MASSLGCSVSLELTLEDRVFLPIQHVRSGVRSPSSFGGDTPSLPCSSLLDFRHVVWPLLRPIVIVSTLLDGIRLATSPVMLLLLTNGGPGNSTQVVSLYAFQQAYQRFDFGYASAISVALLVAITGFAMVYVRINSGRGK